MSDSDDLIGSADAEQILSISRATVTRWVAAGKLTSVGRLPSDRGALIFRRADVEALATEIDRAAASA